MKPRRSGSPEPSATQLELLSVIEAFTTRHRYPPAITDLCRALQVSSTNGVADRIRRLEAKGLVTRVPRTARSLCITDLGRVWLAGRYAA